jgi:hypothetical protein
LPLVDDRGAAICTAGWLLRPPELGRGGGWHRLPALLLQPAALDYAVTAVPWHHMLQRQQEIDVPRGDPGSDPHSYAARDHPPAGERGSGPCARPSGLRPLLTALPIVGCGGPPAQGSSPARPAVSRPVHTTPGLVSPGLPATTRLPRSPCRGRDQVASTRGIRPGQWLTLILDDASTAPRPGALPLGGSSVGEWRAAARRRWGLVPRAAPIVLNALHARLLVAGLL